MRAEKVPSLSSRAHNNELIRHTQEISTILQRVADSARQGIDTLTAWHTGYNLVVDGGATGAGGTVNDYTAWQKALASGAKYIVVPPTDNYYYISVNPQTDLGEALDIPAGVEIVGFGKPEIRHDSSLSTDMFSSTSARIGMHNLRLNGNYSATSATALIYLPAGNSYHKFSNLDLVNAKGYGIYSGGTFGSSFKGIYTENCQNSGLELDETGTFGNVVEDFTANGNIGMGIRLHNGAYGNSFSKLRTTSNSLELLGMTYACHHNRISDVDASGTGDNGVSITGYYNTLSDIITHANDHNGLSIYGHGNMANNIHAFNNNQSAGGFCGITLSGGFGGRSDNNILSNLNTYDDQGSPTQTHGTVFGGNNYTLWATGAVKALRSFAYYGNNVYESTTAGTTGITAPTHTTGTVSDGGVSWKFLYTTATSHHATGNYVTGYTGFGNTGSLLRNDAASGTNYTADYTVAP